MTLTKEFTQKLYDNFAENTKYRAVENAATKNGLLNALESRESHAANLPEFSIDLTKDPVSNQKQSGRCWMFAALNTFRHKTIADFKLDKFEFSQAYTFFWDKYEKSNWFFEQLLANPEMDSERLRFLLQTPQGDGGQWDMIVAIFQKYGVVPKSIYPESVASSASHELDQYLNKLLRQDAQLLLEAAKANQDTTALRETLLSEIFNYLAATLGLPPQKFDFAIRDKDGQNLTKFSGTPQEFYDQFVGVDLDEYVSVINAPTKDKPFNQSYTVEFLGNVVGSKAVKHLNVDMDRFKKLAIAQMQQGETVWFGCDVGQVSNRKAGLLTLDAYDFETALDIKFTQDKASRLDYAESLMTHAMVLTGVDLDDAGQSKKWKIENSWGKDAGEFDGYFVASDEWMDEFTYQIVVRKEFLTSQELQAYEAKPKVLLPWDPMGALAI
ncbi:aminopeptidase C [Lactococcus hircilactis]|uniref:Aminopeptidase n=1 Tax=Lactococcus hircilactis TaxID=1494462 RepID=A0A7X1Z931_9LACT|nr:aminopeptidase C [Lactococcus hircilactis]MQW40078.1 aminopeptidase C [Lactococcus hircilactis]